MNYKVFDIRISETQEDNINNTELTKLACYEKNFSKEKKF